MPRAWATPSGARDLPYDAKRVGRRQPAQPGQPLVERLALEHLHRDVRRAVDVMAEVEDLDDAGIEIAVAARASLKNRSRCRAAP